MKKQAQLWLGTMVVLLVILSTVLAGCAPSPAIANPAPVISAPVSASAVAPSANNGPNEGVKVHGYWTIDVTNPDGSLAEHREFENSLTNQGAIFLAQVMGRAKSVGAWDLYVDNTSSGSNAFQYRPDPAGMPTLYSSSGAHIYEPFYTPLDESESNNLTVTVPTTGANVNKLVLRGTAVSNRDGSINRVSSSLSVIPNNMIPTGVYMGPMIFSGTVLANPVSLTSGQQVAVTVVISFS